MEARGQGRDRWDMMEGRASEAASFLSRAWKMRCGPSSELVE